MLTCDWLTADLTLLGVGFGEALDAVGFLLLGGELLPRQLSPAAPANKTVSVKSLIVIGHAACHQHLRGMEMHKHSLFWGFLNTGCS